MARVRVLFRQGARLCGVMVIAASLACKSAPVAVVTTPVAATVPRDRKLGWILRLEHARALHDPGVVAASTALLGTARASTLTPASAAALDALSIDPDPVVRRRAVQALGRVGAREGLPWLQAALVDVDADVRGAAAFGLGLMGAAARDAVRPLAALLADQSLVVRTRAIEGLGLIGDASVVPAIYQTATGCSALLAPVGSDDESSKGPELELCRIALFAFVRLQNYDAVAALTLNAQGQPVSRWWPVAYALQRIGDRRAAPALLTLAATPGVDVAGFALRGLGALKDPALVPIARAAAMNPQVDIKVRVAAVRALGQVGSVGSAALMDVLASPMLTVNLQIETLEALGASAQPSAFDALIDFVNDSSPAVRSAALDAAARVSPEAFMVVLSGLGPDADWSVRAALAGTLATLPPERITSALKDLSQDADARVRVKALEALAAVNVPDLTSRLFAGLEAPDFVERMTAARLIGVFKPAGGATRLVAAYERGQSDAAYGARAAALEALSKYSGDDVSIALRRGLGDRDWAVRWRAATLLNEMGDLAAEPERPARLRQPAEYFESDGIVNPAFSPHAFIDTKLGAIEVELNMVDAVLTSRNFIDLSRAGFFNGIRIHRLVPAFVIQAGDPRGDGEGGPGYTIPDELNSTTFVRGTMGMALDWRDTGGSQWFITLSPQPHLDARYTAFGHVVGGWDVLDRLSMWDTIDRIRVWDGVDFR